MPGHIRNPPGGHALVTMFVANPNGRFEELTAMTPTSPLGLSS